MKIENNFKNLSLSVIFFWFIIFSLLPFAVMIGVSFFSHNDQHLVALPFNLQNYIALNNSIFIWILQKSLLIAGCATLLCLVLGYPFAFILARISHPALKAILILLLMIPFWTSSLIRSYALIAIIKTKGILNSFLLALGIIHEPLAILFTNAAVLIGLVYNLLPFMILPILTNVERLDTRLIDAAEDLGANRFTTFRKIILPLTMPGIIAGSILVFLPAMTLFYISDILGGAKSVLLGNLIQNKFLIAENWPMGAAVSVVLTMMLVTLITIYLFVTRGNKRQNWL